MMFGVGIRRHFNGFCCFWIWCCLGLDFRLLFCVLNFCGCLLCLWCLCCGIAVVCFCKMQFYFLLFAGFGLVFGLRFDFGFVCLGGLVVCFCLTLNVVLVGWFILCIFVGIVIVMRVGIFCLDLIVLWWFYWSASIGFGGEYCVVFVVCFDCWFVCWVCIWFLLVLMICGFWGLLSGNWVLYLGLRVVRVWLCYWLFGFVNFCGVVWLNIGLHFCDFVLMICFNSVDCFIYLFTWLFYDCVIVWLFCFCFVACCYCWLL